MKKNGLVALFLVMIVLLSGCSVIKSETLDNVQSSIDELSTKTGFIKEFTYAYGSEVHEIEVTLNSSPDWQCGYYCGNVNNGGNVLGYINITNAGTAYLVPLIGDGIISLESYNSKLVLSVGSDQSWKYLVITGLN